MRTHEQMRLECLRLAATFVTSKAIDAKNVTAKADELYNWVTAEPVLSAREELKRPIYKEGRPERGWPV